MNNKKYCEEKAESSEKAVFELLDKLSSHPTFKMYKQRRRRRLGRSMMPVCHLISLTTKKTSKCTPTLSQVPMVERRREETKRSEALKIAKIEHYIRAAVAGNERLMEMR